MVKRNPQPKPTAARVYSYIRFSNPEQSLGDSERRQLDGAKAYAQRIGQPFDESLRMTDRGLSGYSGANIDRGALGQFLQRVESGDIPRGSTLVVENIDRISRQEFMEAFNVITTLVEAGVIIHTLSPEQTYDRQALNGPAIYGLFGQMQMAHDESKKKSDRLSTAWSEKRKRATENGELLTGRTPAWLAINEAGQIEPIPDAAKTIRMIFDLKMKGMGKERIVAFLNDQAPWKPPKSKKRKTDGWRPSYVAKILSNPAVIGVCQLHTGRGKSRKPDGEPLPDYFPAIVKPDLFHAVQKTLRENAGRGGETGKATNLFPYLVKCAYCGGSMLLVNKGNPPKGDSYLTCDNGRRGIRCKSHSIRYAEVENMILDNCQGLRPQEILPDPDEQAVAIRRLRDRLTGIDAKLDDIATRTDNLVQQIERASTPAMRDRYQTRIGVLDAEKVLLDVERKTVAEDLDRAEASTASVEKWTAELKDLHRALKGGKVEVRLRARAHLRELIERVEVFAVGWQAQRIAEPLTPHRGLRRPGEQTRKPPRKISPDWLDGDDIEERLTEVVRETNPQLFRSREFRPFVRHVLARRMSKEGRFIRIHFKTGSRRYLVPAGSIGDGYAFEKENGRLGWRIVQPDVTMLWQQYEQSGKRGKV